MSCDVPGGAGRKKRRMRRTVEVEGLDHVELTMPVGEEALARLFYGRVLGLQEVRKPRAVGRGGAWFIGPGMALHLSTAEPFRPARQAHPALIVSDIERARRRLAAHGVPAGEETADLWVRRFSVSDPFGNRIELIDARDAGFTETRRLRTSGDR